MFHSIFDLVTNLFHKPDLKIPAQPKGWQPEWTEFIKSFYRKNDSMFEIISNNVDMLSIRPDWNALNKEQKLSVLAYFWQCIALFESNYVPTCKSVDVGQRNNLDTWSVGLLQMSVIDQRNYGFDLGYDFEDLQRPIPNLDLGLRVMDKQLMRRKKILIPQGQPGTYWATIHPGGRYDKSPVIKKMVQSFKV